ncbi:4-galactosyl-N-acetylglucosaminide 3-alpha-L-fucosyltransferase FUT6-like [Patiria miniata]|uniref:Fucosyltransferase n=1 Tax=Patiria miniata TaxID=46514 RepID=A0A913ZA27_PATMI|nr:4-galactosyl-N-acetylglucosaminide 3-alpha-L-fucosyltransferase FUT6-like [Patiria miniata]
MTKMVLRRFFIMLSRKALWNKTAVVLGCLTGALLWMLTSGVVNISLGIADGASTDANTDRFQQLRHAPSVGSLIGKRLIESMYHPVPTTGCVKKVLIFGEMKDMKDWPELQAITAILREDVATGAWSGRTECPTHNCNISLTVSANLSLIAGMDAVVLGMLPKIFETHLKDLIRIEPPKGQTWIYFSTESPFRVTKWSKSFALRQLKYHKTMTYRRDSDVYLPFGYYREFLPNENRMILKKHNHALGKEDLIVWIGSNCFEVTWPRIPFIDRLQELLPLKTYGKCGNLTCYPARSERCNRVMRKFKFYLALANSECRDYITEKFWANSLGYNIVPVVYGAPREDFEKVAPPDSFIHVSDFPSLEALAEYLRFLDQDDALYNSYFDWRKRGVIGQSFPIAQTTICQILPHLYNGSEQKVKRIGDSEWYNGCRKPVQSIKGFVVERQFALYSSWKPWRLTDG